MVFALFSDRRESFLTTAAGGGLLTAALLAWALAPVAHVRGQTPPSVQTPDFDPPGDTDPLTQPDETEGEFEFTPPFDFSSPSDDAGTQFDTNGQPPADSGGAGGPTRRPVPSSLEEPEDPDDVILPWGFQGLGHDGPVLPPNDCSKCLIGACSGHYRWYGSLDYISLHRSRPDGVGFTVEVNQFVGNLVNRLSTDNLVFAFEPGVRATLGRCLGTDCKNRDHSIEISYLGVNEWEESFALDAGDGGPLFSAFLLAGSPGTVFDGANRHEVQYVSDLNSFQLDYKIRRRLSKDRMVFRPEGTWHREAWPGLVPAIYFGVRHVSANEDFLFRSTTTGAANESGLYTASTRNNLFGVHAGGELFYQAWKGSVGVRGGAAGMTNFLEVFGGLTSVSDTTAADNFVVRRQIKDQDMAVVGDFAVVGKYRLTKQLTVEIAYNMIWIGGIAQAPEQFAFNVNEPIRLNRQGFTFYQGFSIGGEFVW